jgi:hypothetical protein
MRYVGKADSGVSLETFEAEAFDWRLGEFRLKSLGIHAQNLLKINSCPTTIESELPVFADWCFFLIWAGNDTLFATEEPVSDFLGQPRRDLSFVFYRQVINTQPGIELTIGSQSTCRTGIETLAAIGTVAGNRLIGWQFQVGDNLAEKYPAAEPGIDEHVVLADKAQPRPDRQRPFGKGYRVHANFGLYAGPGKRFYKIGKPVQSLFDK